MGRPAKFNFHHSYEPEPNSGCWLWTGTLTSLGYGRLWVRDPTKPNGWRSTSAHRYSYEIHVGPISAGLDLDHKCRVRCCVNPAHLEPITHLENVRRGIAGEVNGARGRGRTHCIRGHEFNEENTTYYPWGRHCRVCDRERAAAKRAAKGRKYVHLTWQQRHNIPVMRANGLSTAQIAMQYQVDISTIQGWLRRLAK